MAQLPQNSNPTNVVSSKGRKNNDRRMSPPEQLILNITNPDLRENALLILSKNQDRFQDLAPCLWNSVGTIAALIQEIIAIYPFLSPPTLTSAQSNRVCNTLALLQCVASDQRTKKSFLKAQMPMYILPFLSTDSIEKPFEYLRLSSLGVIGGLVKDDDAEVIRYLLSTEIILFCLRIMESSGTELSKTVATYIILKILVDDAGLNYVCTKAERFYLISRGLGITVDALVEQPSARLLKHIIRCYLRLSHHTRSCEVLKSGLPNKLQNGTFNNILQNEPTIRGSLEELLQKLQVSRAGV